MVVEEMKGGKYWALLPAVLLIMEQRLLSHHIVFLSADDALNVF